MALIIAALMTSSLDAQIRSYATSGGELILSFANIDNNNINPDNIIRFSPVFNLQVYGNFDFNKHFGLIAGGSIRNVGFINGNTDIDNSGIKKKYRNYNFGIPVGIKIGNLNKLFIYGGYEIEFPFHYKEKTFVNGTKQDTKISTWFSKRTPTFYNTVFAGIQFPYGLSFKFKYYFTNFFNEDFTETVGGETIMPYKGYKANIFYFSLSFALFQNNKVYYKESKKTSDYY
jgi:hypothetical protein